MVNVPYNDKFLFQEEKIKQVLEHTIVLIKRAEIDNYSYFFQNKIPEAILSKTKMKTPIYFQCLPKKYLDEMKEFYLENSNEPIINYFLGLYQEHVIDHGEITENSIIYYKKGADLNDPYCNFKLAEILIRKNEKACLEDILKYLLKSFFVTCFELDKNPKYNIFESDLVKIDTFHYLTYYYKCDEEIFIRVLRDLCEIENFSTYFIDALLLIFKSLYDLNESRNILKLLREGISNNDRKAAFFYCSVSLLYQKTFPSTNFIDINNDYIIKILEELSEEGNPFASEKLGLILDLNQEYKKAFLYLKRGSKYLLPKSLRLFALYYPTNKNPYNIFDPNLAVEYFKKAYMLGSLGAMYLVYVQYNRDWERLLVLSNLATGLGIFGSDFFLGKCCEKGRGVEQNLELAKSIFIKCLDDTKNPFFSLYRIAKIYELEKKYHIADQLYKVVFMIHKTAYSSKNDQDSEKWVLNTYKMAVMLSKGKGVTRDKIKSNILLDEVLNKRSKLEYDSFTLLIIDCYAAKLREKNLKDIQIQKELDYLKINPVISFKKSRSLEKLRYDLDQMSIIGNHATVIDHTNNELEQFNSRLDKKYDESMKLPCDLGQHPNHIITNDDELDFNDNTLGKSEIILKRLMRELDNHFKFRKLCEQALSQIKNDMNLLNTRIEFIYLKDLQIDYEIITHYNSVVSVGWLNNSKVIIKEFKINQEKFILNALEEIILQSNFNHKNINSLKNICFGFNPLRIITLHELRMTTFIAHLQNTKLNLRTKFNFTLQILEGINYLHSFQPPIVHCDLKPENILIDRNLNLELRDFSLSKVLTTDTIETNEIFTPRFSPPELIKYKITSKARDIWAVGLIIYEIFFGVHLFDEVKINELIEFLMVSNSVTVKDDYNTPNDITQLIRKCLEFDPNRRPKINELIEETTRIYQFLEDSYQL